MEVRSRLTDAVQSRNIAFVPVVQQWRTPDKARQQRARPGSELARRILSPLAVVNSYVRTLLAMPAGQGANEKRGGNTVSTGRGQVVTISWKRVTRGGDEVEPPGPPWHWAHARRKTALPCCSG